jgi:hypothetical protein
MRLPGHPNLLAAASFMAILVEKTHSTRFSIVCIQLKQRTLEKAADSPKLTPDNTRNTLYAVYVGYFYQ